MQQINVSKVSVRSKGYNPDQPRVPAGQEGGGRWTSAGGSVSSAPDFVTRAIRRLRLPRHVLDGVRFVEGTPATYTAGLDGLFTNSDGGKASGFNYGPAVWLSPKALASLQGDTAADRWYGENTLLHEVAHAHWNLHRIDNDALAASRGRPSVHGAFNSAKDEYRSLGRLAGDAFSGGLSTNAMSSVEEFFAEAFAVAHMSGGAKYKRRLDAFLKRHGASLDMVMR